MKKVSFSNKKSIEGVNQLCDALKITIGPCGHNALIAAEYKNPFITNDGYTIAREFVLKDKWLNAGVGIGKEAIEKTNDNVGEGRTTCAILLQSILNEGVKAIENIVGVEPMGLRKEIIEAKDEVLSIIKSKKKDCTNPFEVARVSAKSDYLGKLVSDIFSEIGSDGMIKIEHSDKDEVIYSNGIEIDRGFADMEIEDVSLILMDSKLTSIPDLKEVFDNQFSKGNTRILIIANGYDDNVLEWIKYNNNSGGLQIIAITSPGFAETKKEFFEDISNVTKTKIGLNKDNVGTVPKVVSDEEKTIIFGVDTSDRVKEIKSKKAESEHDKDKVEDRIRKLSSKVATIMVGAKTDVERTEKIHHLQDSVKATQAAIDSGVVKGGGLSLVDASKKMKTDTNGSKIIQKAIQSPYKQINENGFKFEDTDVVDAFKVIETALENAVSVATSLLTTGVTMVEDVTERSKE